MTSASSPEMKPQGFATVASWHLDPGAGPGFDEPQELRSAEDMVSVVLSRTLESWGIRACPDR